MKYKVFIDNGTYEEYIGEIESSGIVKSTPELLFKLIEPEKEAVESIFTIEVNKPFNLGLGNSAMSLSVDLSDIRNKMFKVQEKNKMVSKIILKCGDPITLFGTPVEFK